MFHSLDIKVSFYKGCQLLRKRTGQGGYINSPLKDFVEKKKNNKFAFLTNDIRYYKLMVFNIGKKLRIISKTLET